MAFENGVIYQCFQWYSPGGGLWRDLAAGAPDLAAAGFTALWIPPSYKGSGGGFDVGYGVYDLFDLGEFHQKNTVATKYGTRAELMAALVAARDNDLQVYADVVFNHRDGADRTEEVMAQEMSWGDRNRPISDWRPIKAWTGFDFPGRGDRHSSMKWAWWCFDAVSYDENDRHAGASRLYRLKDKSFETGVSHEHGNYDYLMAADLDTDNEFVRGELRYWGEWFHETTRVDGFRLDASKHIRAAFQADWVRHLRGKTGQPLFTVGEYWSSDVEELHRYIVATEGAVALFDVPLHFRFHEAGRAGAGYDLRRIFDRTLVAEQPALAVPFVDNHDTQPCQSLESWVEPWFKPLAYALILLRKDGYPCVFAGDYQPRSTYTDKGREVTLHSHQYLIDRFLWARRRYGFGDQQDYFDHPNTVGWLRTGDGAHPGAMAVLLSNGWEGEKWMNTHRPHAIFTDVTGHIQQKVISNAAGWAHFRCPAGSVSVWTQD
jgi:alpha-amylase